MNLLEKSKKELNDLKNILCHKYNDLLNKYNIKEKNKTLFEKKVSKLKKFIELKQLDAKIDVLSDAIESIETKINIFKEMPRATVNTTRNIANTSSSESIKTALESMKKIINKEYKELDTLVYKKVLSQYFVDERRKGLKKYELGNSITLGAAFGMIIAVLLSTTYNSMIMPFVFITLGSTINTIINIIKVNRKIKLFKKLNDELGNDKLELESENGMQEVYDLTSKINKKSYDLMIMETICKEQERTLEEAIDYESKSKFENELKVKPSYVQSSEIHSLTQESVAKLIRK